MGNTGSLSLNVLYLKHWLMIILAWSEISIVILCTDHWVSTASFQKCSAVTYDVQLHDLKVTYLCFYLPRHALCSSCVYGNEWRVTGTETFLLPSEQKLYLCHLLSWVSKTCQTACLHSFVKTDFHTQFAVSIDTFQSVSLSYCKLLITCDSKHSQWEHQNSASQNISMNIASDIWIWISLQIIKHQLFIMGGPVKL